MLQLLVYVNPESELTLKVYFSSEALKVELPPSYLLLF